MRARVPRSLVALAVGAALVTSVVPAAQASGVDAAAEEVEQAKAEVAELGREVEAASAEYEQVQQRLEAQQARVEAAQEQAEEQARLIAAMEEQLVVVAVEAFKRGGLDPRLELLATGELERSAATASAGIVAERASVTVKDLKEAQERLARLQRDAEEGLVEVQALEADLAERRADIEARLEGAQDVLAIAEAEHQAQVAAQRAREEEQASRAARGAVAAPSGSGQLATPVAGRWSSGFGWRTHPVYGDQRFHNGLDISAPCGTPVVAAESGTVTSASWNGSYGNILVIDHGDGTSTAYAHLQGFGASGAVERGQVVGYVGTTGLSTGCHLHFEVRVGGQAVDPAGYL